MHRIIISIVLLSFAPCLVHARSVSPLQKLPPIKFVEEKPNNPRELILKIRQDIKAEPFNPNHYIYLAYVYDHIGQYKYELEVLKKGVNYFPKDHPDLGLHYGNLARAYILMDELDQAKEWIDQSLELDPRNLYNLWHALTYYVLKRDFLNAAEPLTKLSSLDQNRDYFYDIYVFFYKRYPKDTGKLSELYEEAVRLKKDNPYARRMLGITLRDASVGHIENNLDVILSELQISLELLPENVPALIGIANTYLLASRETGKKEYLQKANPWLQKAYGIAPLDPQLAFAMGNLYYYNGQFNEAIDRYEFARLKGMSGDLLLDFLASSYANQAYGLYKFQKDLQKGIELIDQAITLRPQKGSYWGVKGQILYELKEFTQAHEIIQKALVLDPDEEGLKQNLLKIEEAMRVAEDREEENP